MVTYCKHSNAPVEYALKEEELLRPKPSKVKAWTFEAKVWYGIVVFNVPLDTL